MFKELLTLYKRGFIDISDMQEQAKNICHMFCDTGMSKEERESLKDIIDTCDNTIGKKDKTWWSWDRDYLYMFYISPVVYSAI